MDAGYWAVQAAAPGRREAPALAPQRPPRRPSSRLRPVLCVTLVVTLFWAWSTGGMPALLRMTGDATVRSVSTPAPAVTGWGPSYVDAEGRPGRWDPCRPIPYVLQAGWMPDSGRADVAEALRRVEVATGLAFVYEGDTDEMPSHHREPYQPQRYGDRWAPLLIGWVPAGSTDLGVGEDAQGVSVAVAVPNDGGPSLVSGQVVLDATHRLYGGFGPGGTEGEVLLHELGHAVGLGHVLDPTQVMYPQVKNSLPEFGAGDREGLAAVGAAAGCHPPPRARPLRR